MSRNGPKTHEDAVKATAIDCSKFPSRTVQSDANEADINKILARLDRDGMLARLREKEPFYGDVSEFDGLQEAIVKVQDANHLFMEMSADIRSRFDNDPVKMVDFLADDKNRPEAELLGMVVPKPVLVPPVVPAP